MTKPTLVHTPLYYTVTKKKKSIHKATDQSGFHKKNKKKIKLTSPGTTSHGPLRPLTKTPLRKIESA